MVEESLDTAEPMPAKKKGSRLHNSTSSTFELGVPDDGVVSSFRTFLDYSVSLAMQDSEEQELKLCTYKCKFVAIFSVLAKHGFDDWKDASEEAIQPYFSFVHHLVRQRAEERLLAAGFRGLELLVPDNLKAQAQVSSV